jgi:hypothetical protein
MTTTTAPDLPAGALSAGEVLAGLAAARSAEHAAAARTLVLAATWADLHPAPEPGWVACFAVPGAEQGEPIAGPGCPEVAEFCCAELGAVLGVSTDAAKRLLGHALELRHRLPRLWALVQAGRVPPWQARRVAEATIHTCPRLTLEAARWVDGQVAAAAGKIGPTQLDRLLTEALTRFHLTADPAADPASDPVDGWLHHDPRHATVEADHVGIAGTMRLHAELSIADALDVDHALTAGADALRRLGHEASLDIRRSLALGDLARTQTALDLHTPDPDSEPGPGPSPDTPTPRARAGRVARELVLHVHLAAAALGDGTLLFDPLGRLEEGHRLVLLDHVRSWCADTRTRIRVQPVIDLNIEQTATGYAVPDRLRDQVILRDHTCVFPWCPRPARRCDLDHVIPYDPRARAEPRVEARTEARTEDRSQPGPTSTANLAALCRRHHRLKTHSAWRVQMPQPGVLIWTSPHGHRYRRDATGTTPLDPTGPRRPEPARP